MTRARTFPSPALLSAVATTLVSGPALDDEIAADHLAREVMRGAPARAPAARASFAGAGAPLPHEVRAFMEPRFGAGFADVRVHTGPWAAALCRGLGARAFAYGADVYYGEGAAPGNDALTAHELAHVLQQRGRAPRVAPKIQVWPFTGSAATAARSKAFDRRGEIVKRLNVTSSAFACTLVAAGSGKEELQTTLIPGIPVTRFDKLMDAFAKRTDQVIPLFLVDGNDFVPDSSGTLVSICQDNFLSGKVDIDDLAADDDWGFQAAFVHILTERYAAANYKDHLGDEAYLMPLYLNAHFAARDNEGELYKYLFRDNTIVAPHNTLTDRTKPYEITFTSKNGYTVMERIDRPSDAVAGLKTWVEKNPITKVSVDDFIKERALLVAPVPP